MKVFFFDYFRPFFSEDNAPNVSQEQGMLMKYIDNPAYDLAILLCWETV
jgi:hypothetical protein